MFAMFKDTEKNSCCEKQFRNSNNMIEENHTESFKLLDDSNSNNSESETTNYIRIPRRKVKTKRKSRLDSASRNKAKQHCSFFSLLKILGVLILIIIFSALGWLVFNLYEKIDHLTQQLQNVESGTRKFPEAQHKIHARLKSLEDDNTALKSNFSKVSQDIFELTKQVQELLQTTESLSKSIEAAPQIEALPKKVATLEQHVATMGSTITTLKSTVKEVREASGNNNKVVTDSIKDIQLQMSSLQNKSKSLSDNFEHLQIVCNNNSKVYQLNFDNFQEELKQLSLSLSENNSFSNCSPCNTSVQIKMNEQLDNLTKLYHILLIKFSEFQEEDEKDLNKNLVNMDVIRVLEASINQSLTKLEESNSRQLEDLRNDVEFLMQKTVSPTDASQIVHASNSNNTFEENRLFNSTDANSTKILQHNNSTG